MLPCREKAPRDADAVFRTDWAKLGPVLARAAAAVVDAAAAGEYQGLNFYGSCGPALKPLKRPPPSRFMMHSAMMLRAEFRMERNSTLRTASAIESDPST